MRVSRKETRVSEEKEHSSLESERDEEHSQEKFICAVENKVRERLWVSKSPAKERSSMSVRNVPRSLGDSVCSDASNVRNAPDNNNYSNYYNDNNNNNDDNNNNNNNSNNYYNYCYQVRFEL